MVHASGNTFMKVGKTKQDVRRLLGLGINPLWVTLTETLDEETILAIKQLINKHELPYRLINPDNGDISFLIQNNARPIDWGGELSVPAQPGPAREGGHGPRFNSWCEIHAYGETIFINGVHLVTYFERSDHAHSDTRPEQQLKQVRDLGAQMRKQAKGRNLAVGSGDLNGILPNRKDMQAVFDEFKMITTAEETGVMTGTHGSSRIDYVWTMEEQDRRLSVADMKVLKSPVYNSDHDPIVVDLLIA
jgi:hypothetical protein